MTREGICDCCLKTRPVSDFADADDWYSLCEECLAEMTEAWEELTPDEQADVLHEMEEARSV